MTSRQTSLQQGIYDRSCRLIVSLTPSPSALRADQQVGIGRPRASRQDEPHRERWTPLREQTRLSKGNEEGRPQGYRSLVNERTGPARFLVEWPSRDRKVDHHPNICRDDIRGWKARGQLLLLTRLRGT